MKSVLVGEVSEALEASGYEVLDCSGLRSCFDVLAKGQNRLLVVKVLANIEGLTRKSAAELQHVASALSGVPLVVGDHMKSEALQRGVIYSRYGVHVLAPKTLEDVAEDKMPLIYSVRGNYCVKIDSSLLVKLRRRLEFTQDDLASELGVSKQTVHRYEFSGRMSMEIANRLADLLEESILLPEDLFSGATPPSAPDAPPEGGLKRLVYDKLISLGFSASLTNAPFDIVAVGVHRERVLAAVSDDSRRLRHMAEVVQEASEMVGGFGVCVSNRADESDAIVVRPRDFFGIRHPRDLFSLLSG